MKTQIKKLSIALIAIIMLGALMPSTFNEEVLSNEFLKDLKSKLKQFNDENPEDRVYLHFDKPLYKPGETIWFSAFVRNGTDLKSSKKSEILYAELTDPRGSVVKKLNLIARNGKTNGDFNLSKNMIGGLYKIKAYTNWQKNNNTFFEKEIQVQKVVLPRLKMKMDFQRKSYGPGDVVIATLNLATLENNVLSNYECKYIAQIDGEKLTSEKISTNNEGTAYVKFELPKNLTTNDGLVNVMIAYEGKTESISRAIPITLGNIDLSFFPEGGDLVEGLSTKIAFKALDEHKKQTDIEGVIINSKNKIVANFTSFHNGMGAFDFEYKIGEKYKAKITKPEGVNEIYSLPETLKRGWVMNINQTNENLIVTVNSTENETMSLMCQVRGKHYFSREVNVQRGSNTFKIPLEKFPIGVAQITLFDARNIARAERLAFVNKEQQMNIEILTNKEKYLPREKVKMTIKVSDERGLPIPADLSLAVVDDKLLSFADDKSSNILSSLLLEQDILSKVEEPDFYFNPKEEKANRALDYLLMTDGWRRFKWEKIQNKTWKANQYEGEKAIISGVVKNQSGELLNNAKVMLNDGSSKFVKTDKNGMYIIDFFDLHQPLNLTISANGKSNSSIYINSYGNNYNTILYDIRKYSTASSSVKRNKHFVPAGKNVIQKMKVAGNGQIPNVEMDMVAFPPEDNVGKAKINDDADDFADEEIEQAEENIMGFAEIMNKDGKLDRRRIAPNNGIIYHRAREFAVPNYSKEQSTELRTDFRTTIYWNGNLHINNKGLAYVEFYNNDDVSSFRTTVEGIGVGMVGRAEKTFYTQLPFVMYAKVPSQVVFQDMIKVPLTLKNTTNKTITGNLSIETPKGFKVLKVEEGSHTIPAKSTKTIYLQYEVMNEIGEDNLKIAFQSNGFSDAFNQSIKIGAKGFPSEMAFSGHELTKEYVIDITNPVEGSVIASFTAFPNVVTDLMTGVESIIREPSGCFEQTSMSNYPNIMALNYMNETGFDDDALLASIDGKLDRGYKKLTSYETKEKGYEWFGSAPGHEALTAYGLMQFNDMKSVYNHVNQGMVERTANWLLSRKDGTGGFKKNPKALDQFGRASEDVTNGYIVYALSEAGYQSDIQKEFNAAYNSALNSNDGYLLAMMANTLSNFEDKREKIIVKKLLKLQLKDGSFPANHSITRSGGKSLQIETTAIAILAMLKSSENSSNELTKAVEFIVKNRNSYGGFGSTQGTVLALKALSTYAAISKKTDEAGTIEFFIDEKLIATKNYEKGATEKIEISGFEKYLKDGRHKIKVQYKGTNNALPYTLGINYNTTLPKSSEQCNVDMKAYLSKKSCKVGETVRLTTKLKNKQDKGMPMTLAIVGIPSGLSAQPWQLKELQEKGKIGFYEITDNFVVFYFRDLAPNAEHIINLDLKAEVPGKYEAPASSGYLYYTNEYKCWSSTGSILIRE